MDCLIECFLELLGGVMEAICESIHLPKWLRITLLTVFLAGIAALLIFAVARLGFIVLQVLLVLAGFGLVIYLCCLLCWNLRHGTLRKARKEDLQDVRKLYHSVIGKPGCNWSLLYPNEATLQEDFRTGNLYVLWKKRQIIGAASAVPDNELDDLSLWCYRENAREIARIVIAPQFQGKGHGKYLIRMLCKRMRKEGCRAVHLLASTQNRSAIALYRETGFFSRGPVHRYDHDYYAFERKL